MQHWCEIYNVGSSAVYEIKKEEEKTVKFYADSEREKYVFGRH